MSSSDHLSTFDGEGAIFACRGRLWMRFSRPVRKPWCVKTGLLPLPDRPRHQSWRYQGGPPRLASMPFRKAMASSRPPSSLKAGEVISPCRDAWSRERGGDRFTAQFRRFGRSGRLIGRFAVDQAASSWRKNGKPGGFRSISVHHVSHEAPQFSARQGSLGAGCFAAGRGNKDMERKVKRLQLGKHVE